MARFRYRALNPDGDGAAGVLSAASLSAAAQELRRQGLTPLEVVPGEEADREAEAGGGRFGRPSGRDVLVFTSQLAAMLRAGMNMPKALGVIGGQSENPRLREILDEVRDSVMGGGALSDCLRNHPKVFDPLYCNMVKVGETSGRLPEILTQLAKHLESSQRLKSNVISALAYPAVILLIGIVSVVLLLVFVIPNLASSFVELDIDLPLLTQFIIKTSEWLGAYWWAPLALTALLLYGARQTLRSEKGRYWLDAQRRRVPILGPTLDKVHLSRMAQTMGILVRSGIPALAALELASETTSSPILAQGLSDSAEKVRKGEPIAESLTATGAVPGIVTSLIAVGEESGQLDEMLDQIAEQYELEVDIAIKRLLSLFEPAIIVVMAVFVGTFVLAFLLPMLTIAQGIE